MTTVPPLKDKEGGETGVRDMRDDEIVALAEALKAAEDRARGLEQLLSESEGKRARQESRAQRLEERVAELEKALTEQPVSQNSPATDDAART